MHPASPAGRWHVVAAGESLDEIARQAGVPVEDVAEINGLAPVERQRLRQERQTQRDPEPDALLRRRGLLETTPAA